MDLQAGDLTVGDHDVVVYVPDTLMEKEGRYQFLVFAEDQHAEKYRYEHPTNHVNKWAIPCGQIREWQLDMDADVNLNGTMGDTEDDQTEESVGAFVVVNDDDDNANGVADSAEAGPVAAEDDLVEVKLQGAPQCSTNNGFVYLVATSGGQKIKVWDSPTKGTEIVLSPDPNQATHLPVVQLPKSVYVEGVQASAAARDVTLALRYGDPLEDRIKWTVVAVKQVEWEGVDPGDGATNLSNDNPNDGGGWRIFPDKNQPGAGAPLHNQVKVRARLQPAVPNWPVTFASFDVDDPSSNTAPLDDETQVQDNRGALQRGSFTHGLPTLVQSTDSTGKAEVQLEVTMQPGDNFRVVGMCDRVPAGGNSDVLGQLEVLQNDGTQARVVHHATPPAAPLAVPSDATTPHIAKATPLLTVWRKLHVERDSMAAVVGNVVQGTLDGVNPDPGSTLDVGQRLPDEADRFQGGKIAISGGVGVRGVLGNTHDSVTIDGAPVSHADVQGEAYTLIDDDDLGLLPDLPDIGGQAFEAFKEAYIELIDDGGGNPANNKINVDFWLNVKDSRTQITKPNALESDGARSSSFWVAYVQSAYQGPYMEDNDPNSQDAVGGATPMGTRRIGSLVYLETIRDLVMGESGLGEPWRALAEQRTVTHEIGHTFGLEDHNPPQYDPPGPSVMDYDDFANLGNPGGSRFNATELDVIRRRTESPGS